MLPYCPTLVLSSFVCSFQVQPSFGTAFTFFVPFFFPLLLALVCVCVCVCVCIVRTNHTAAYAKETAHCCCCCCCWKASRMFCRFCFHRFSWDCIDFHCAISNLRTTLRSTRTVCWSWSILAANRPLETAAMTQDSTSASEGSWRDVAMLV